MKTDEGEATIDLETMNIHKTITFSNTGVYI